MVESGFYGYWNDGSCKVLLNSHHNLLLADCGFISSSQVECFHQLMLSSFHLVLLSEYSNPSLTVTGRLSHYNQPGLLRERFASGAFVSSGSICT